MFRSQLVYAQPRISRSVKIQYILQQPLTTGKRLQVEAAQLKVARAVMPPILSRALLKPPDFAEAESQWRQSGLHLDSQLQIVVKGNPICFLNIGHVNVNRIHHQAHYVQHKCLQKILIFGLSESWSDKSIAAGEVTINNYRLFGGTRRKKRKWCFLLCAPKSTSKARITKPPQIRNALDQT